MTEDEAKKIAIKETDYCYVLSSAWEGEPNNSVCSDGLVERWQANNEASGHRCGKLGEFIFKSPT